MATVATELNNTFRVGRGEPFAEQVLTVAAMAGAVGGAVGGAALGTASGATFPVVWGGFGTMLGSGLVAGGGYLLARLCAGRLVSYEDGHARDRAAEERDSAPRSS